jgi:hypothetical protein
MKREAAFSGRGGRALIGPSRAFARNILIFSFVLFVLLAVNFSSMNAT